MTIDLTKQPGSQPRGTESPLPDNFDALAAYVDRWYALAKVLEPRDRNMPRKAPPMPAVLQDGVGHRYRSPTTKVMP